MGIIEKKSLVPMGFYWEISPGVVEACSYPSNNTPAYTLMQTFIFLASKGITVGIDPIRNKLGAKSIMFRPYFYCFYDSNIAMTKTFSKPTRGVLESYNVAIRDSIKALIALKSYHKIEPDENTLSPD